MRRFTVAVANTVAEADHHKVVLASLPDHFVLVPISGTPLDAALVGPDDDIAARAIVSAPSHASEGGRQVFPAWRHLPSLQADDLFRSCCRSGVFSLIEIEASILHGSGLRDALIEQLSILRRLGYDDIQLREVTRTSHGVRVSLEINAAIATIGAVVTSHRSGSLRLQAVGAERRLEALLETDAIARPANIRCFSAEGNRQGRPRHQSSHRLTWQRVHSWLAGDLSSASEMILNEDLYIADRASSVLRPGRALSG